MTWELPSLHLSYLILIPSIKSGYSCGLSSFTFPFSFRIVLNSFIFRITNLKVSTFSFACVFSCIGIKLHQTSKILFFGIKSHLSSLALNSSSKNTSFCSYACLLFFFGKKKNYNSFAGNTCYLSL